MNREYQITPDLEKLKELAEEIYPFNTGIDLETDIYADDDGVYFRGIGTGDLGESFIFFRWNAQETSEFFEQDIDSLPEKVWQFFKNN